MAILTAAGSIGATSHADAALFYWPDSDPGYYRPVSPVQPRKPRVRKSSAGKRTVVEKEAGARPQGPLIIAISINQQNVRVYDANGFFAESPVSTGMKGHATPMGVFSIIQKHKMHHSNIYSGAPMPFMQRITWSGVAMHAGVLPGYPASHGCIRMPMSFATKMWNWTRMGARVIVTPGEMSPASFSHPLLVAQKFAPQPAMAGEPKTDAPATKSDKGADASSVTSPAIPELGMELRSTVGHASSISTSRREHARTADASGSMPATSAVVTMSDASPSQGRLPAFSESVGADAKLDVTSPDARPAAADDSSKTKTSTEVSASETMKAETRSDDAKPDGATPDDVTAATSRSEIARPETARSETARPETAQPETANAETARPDNVAKPDVAILDTPKAEDAPKAVEKPSEPANAPAVAPDVKKDTSRLPGVEKSAAAKTEPPKRTGQISVFVSRKDGKLYVRQNFAPLFESPVTIAPSDRLLGTHVFTAESDRNDPNTLRWSVVSLPVIARDTARNEDDERSSRRRRIAGGAAAEVKPMPAPNTPAEALDRISIPPDAMARISEALATGGSIIVSDQGINQGETGEGTDFIVSLR